MIYFVECFELLRNFVSLFVYIDALWVYGSRPTLKVKICCFTLLIDLLSDAVLNLEGFALYSYEAMLSLYQIP